MKIVHITNCLRGGGIQNFLVSLLPEQVKNGHCVTLIVIEKYDYDYCFRLEEILKRNNVIVHRLNKQRRNKLSLLKTIIKSRRLISFIRPDIVNTHGEMSHTFGSIACLCKKYRHVLTIHNSPEPWPCDTKFLCKNKPLIFCSRAAFDMRVQNSKNMEIIENGISKEIVHDNKTVDLRKELKLKKTDRIVVLVGSLRPQKNYILLKEIVKEMNDNSVHFCICGGNYGKGYVSMEEFDNCQTIHCLGLRSDVSAIENEADLFLSCATFEGLPIAVLEAYFNGIPCVLSPIPQHVNISNVKEVWIPKDFSSNSFVRSIRAGLSCTKEHQAIYESRREQIVKYSISRTSEAYIDFYKSCLNLQ